MPYDCLIVGGGPAGLAAAIRMKQLAIENDKDVSVCVLEKGSEIGAHILSGNVFEPRALEELFPDYKNMDVPPPLDTEVKEDVFLYLTETGSVGIPNVLLPSELHNDGNYIISLGQLCRWLGTQAEELGVEIFPGFAASEVIYGEDGSVKGIATRDVGISKEGEAKGTFERGMELHARQTLFAEGARGSCSEVRMGNSGIHDSCV
jgi:electron-transferring-flavoprotein dehydrogenase